MEILKFGSTAFPATSQFMKQIDANVIAFYSNCKKLQNMQTTSLSFTLLRRYEILKKFITPFVKHIGFWSSLKWCKTIQHLLHVVRACFVKNISRYAKFP